MVSLMDGRTRTLRAHLVVSLLAITMPAAAQLYECPVSVPEFPEGRWSVPYAFSQLGSMYELEEITHAAVLPPAAGHEDVMRVLLWCRPKYTDPGASEARTFLWNPSRPGYLLPLPIEASAGDGSTDPFCSGHTFLPDGDLVVFGGSISS